MTPDVPDPGTRLRPKSVISGENGAAMRRRFSSIAAMAAAVSARYSYISSARWAMVLTEVPPLICPTLNVAPGATGWR